MQKAQAEATAFLTKVDQLKERDRRVSLTSKEMGDLYSEYRIIFEAVRATSLGTFKFTKDTIAETWFSSKENQVRLDAFAANLGNLATSVQNEWSQVAEASTPKALGGPPPLPRSTVPPLPPARPAPSSPQTPAQSPSQPPAPPSVVKFTNPQAHPKTQTPPKPITTSFETQLESAHDLFAKAQRKNLQHLGSVFRENRTYITTLENNLAKKKNKNIFNRSESKIKSQLHKAKQREKELDDLNARILAVENQGGSDKLVRLNKLMEPAEVQVELFKTHQKKILGIITMLILKNNKYIKDHPAEQTTTGGIGVGNTTQKLADANIRQKKLEELEGKIRVLTPSNIDLIALDHHIARFEVDIQTDLIKNKDDSGLKRGKVEDMLKEAQTGLKELHDLHKKPTSRTIPPMIPK